LATLRSTHCVYIIGPQADLPIFVPIGDTDVAVVRHLCPVIHADGMRCARTSRPAISTTVFLAIWFKEDDEFVVTKACHSFAFMHAALVIGPDRSSGRKRPGWRRFSEVRLSSEADLQRIGRSMSF